jgi:hypothetical protein
MKESSPPCYSKGNTVKTKHAVFSIIATGGVAAALFGGAAVQTAFTSTATGTLKASTASIGTLLAGGTVTLANAVPGDTGPTSSVTVTNQGSTPETISVAFGAGSNPGLDSVVDVIWDGTDAGSLASLAQSQSLSLGAAVLQPNGSPADSVTIPVALMLEASADDTEANASDSVSFTITGTATSTQATPPPTTPVGGWNILKNNQDTTPGGAL